MPTVVVTDQPFLMRELRNFWANLLQGRKHGRCKPRQHHLPHSGTGQISHHAWATRRSRDLAAMVRPYPSCGWRFCLALRQSDIASHLIRDCVNRIGDQTGIPPSQPGLFRTLVPYANICPTPRNIQPRISLQKGRAPLRFFLPDPQQLLRQKSRGPTARSNANLCHQRASQPCAADVAPPLETCASRSEMPAPVQSRGSRESHAQTNVLRSEVRARACDG